MTDYMYFLIYMVLVFDVILSAVWLLCWICSCGKWIQNYRNFDYASDESAEYPTFSIINPTHCDQLYSALAIHQRQHGLRRIFGFYNQERRIQNLSAFGTPAFAILIVFLVGMTTAALVTVPNSKAFTDAPNRLLEFY